MAFVTKLDQIEDDEFSSMMSQEHLDMITQLVTYNEKFVLDRTYPLFNKLDKYYENSKE